jgi:hypothetical protein
VVAGYETTNGDPVFPPFATINVFVARYFGDAQATFSQ